MDRQSFLLTFIVMPMSLQEESLAVPDQGDGSRWLLLKIPQPQSASLKSGAVFEKAKSGTMWYLGSFNTALRWLS